MDANMVSLTVSTIGLAVAVSIGVSSGLGNVDSPINPGFRITPALSSMMQDCLEHMKSTKAIQKLSTTCISVCRGLRLTCFYAVHGVVCLVHFVRAVQEEYQYFKANFPEIYGRVDWRNFCKLLRIFKVWEPLPYDLLIERPKEALKQSFEDRRHEGFVGVCLRFRTGHIRARKARTGCGQYLHDRHISVPAYVPLEEDGSLRVDLIREEFFVEEIELLIPGRYEIHRVTKGDVISPFMLHELIQDFNCVNVVEHEDIYCMHRRTFREWLRNSKLYYCIRAACYLVTVLSIVFSAIISSIYLSGLCSSKVWSCFVDAFCMILGAMGIVLFFEYRRNKYGKLRKDVLLMKATREKEAIRIPWHTFPPRYSPYRLSEHGRSCFL